MVTSIPKWLSDLDLPDYIEIPTNNPSKVSIMEEDPNPSIHNLTNNFHQGYLWVNKITGKIFINISSSTVAANWKLINNDNDNNKLNASIETVNPDPGLHNLENGFKVGQLWINTATKDIFICTYSDNDTTVWSKLVDSSVVDDLKQKNNDLTNKISTLEDEFKQKYEDLTNKNNDLINKISTLETNLNNILNNTNNLVNNLNNLINSRDQS